MSFTDVSGARIYWKLEGRDDAPALVLLNSIGTDMDLWDPLLPQLREQFRLLRIDTRGHGASDAHDTGDYSLEMLANDVLAVADEAGLHGFSIAGVSLGAMIGMELALLQPERVEKLALVCTSVTMDPAAWQARIDTVLGQGMSSIAELAMGRFLSPEMREDDPALYDTVLRQLVAMDPHGYAGCCAAIRDMDLAGRIGGIASPVLVVTGTRDASTPYEGHGAFLVDTIPGAVHVSVDGAHLATFEAPEALAQALISFVKS
ncbi:3-oxoadipate enol-lactonase [Croceicoccus sediminis]|uniref:3-oxoadipate enol-lactonase n=1 Tax=Croceicoccus sediminis TaxID=2571150 RepID=UPI0011835D52|nr:3-oxoadipate enol-lactonase [Croceicoccus sediminis]